MNYLEIDICGKCNLNCKGCAHFSPLVSKEEVYDLEEFEKDLTELRNKFNIKIIRIMGGEPLLNENWLEYLKISRKLFPHSEIWVVTNGILIEKLSQQKCEYFQK